MLIILLSGCSAFVFGIFPLSAKKFIPSGNKGGVPVDVVPAPYPSSSVILVLDVKEGLESFEDVTAYVEEKTGLKFPAAAQSTLPKEPPDYTDPQTFGLGRISPF